MIEEQECNGCRATGVALTEYRKQWPFRTEETKLLCDLCASTMVGKLNDFSHLRENPDLVEIQRQINYVGNEILKAISRLSAERG